MNKVYPAVIHNDEDGMWISFPDLEGCNTFGNDISELMENAEDAMGLYLASLKESGHELPSPSSIVDIREGKNESKTYVSVNVDRYHRDMRAVKKTVSIPSWQAKAAEKKKISLSKILQQALDSVLE